jgi:putative ABC transport system permease protein
MTVPLSTTKYPQPEDRARVFQQILQRTSELPGVVAAGATGQLPLGGNENIFDFEIEGRPLSAPGARQQAGDITVTPDYFRALNVPLLKGRNFTDSDKADSPPVVVVNETFARRYFPRRRRGRQTHFPTQRAPAAATSDGDRRRCRRCAPSRFGQRALR